jgi:hypothetical protein
VADTRRRCPPESCARRRRDRPQPVFKRGGSGRCWLAEDARTRRQTPRASIALSEETPSRAEAWMAVVDGPVRSESSKPNPWALRIHSDWTWVEDCWTPAGSHWRIWSLASGELRGRRRHKAAGLQGVSGRVRSRIRLSVNRPMQTYNNGLRVAPRPLIRPRKSGSCLSQASSARGIATADETPFAGACRPCILTEHRPVAFVATRASCRQCRGKKWCGTQARQRHSRSPPC